MQGSAFLPLASRKFLSVPSAGMNQNPFKWGRKRSGRNSERRPNVFLRFAPFCFASVRGVFLRFAPFAFAPVRGRGRAGLLPKDHCIGPVFLAFFWHQVLSHVPQRFCPPFGTLTYPFKCGRINRSILRGKLRVAPTLVRRFDIRKTTKE